MKRPSAAKSAAKPKMTMRQYENSPADKTADAREAKRGIKEGTPKEKALDRKELAAINKKRK